MLQWCSEVVVKERRLFAQCKLQVDAEPAYLAAPVLQRCRHGNHGPLPQNERSKLSKKNAFAYLRCWEIWDERGGGGAPPPKFPEFRNFKFQDILKKRLLQKSEGTFPNDSRVNFARDLLVDFVGAFFLGKKQEERSTQNSITKFKSESGSFAAKIHTARIWP